MLIDIHKFLLFFILSFFFHFFLFIILFIFYFYTQFIVSSLFIFLHLFSLTLYSYLWIIYYLLFILSYWHFSINTNVPISNIIWIHIAIYSNNILDSIKFTTSVYFSYFKTAHFIFNIYFIDNQLNCIFSLYTSEKLKKNEIYSIWLWNPILTLYR